MKCNVLFIIKFCLVENRFGPTIVKRIGIGLKAEVKGYSYKPDIRGAGFGS